MRAIGSCFGNAGRALVSVTTPGTGAGVDAPSVTFALASRGARPHAVNAAGAPHHVAARTRNARRDVAPGWGAEVPMR